MSELVRAALGLGSNLGDRERHLDGAVATIAAMPGTTVVAVSRYVESDPVGGPEQPDYLNAVVVVDTTCDPWELLAWARRCEDDAGRVREVRWGPRTLDVDVLAAGSAVVDSSELTLPHPRATERAFVMVPWAEVDPDFVLSGRTVCEWAEPLDGSGLRHVDGAP
jgi:2-amino-4-hydroxy-6-hydroxymethyldihydropteridine diphosphokinase